MTSQARSPPFSSFFFTLKTSSQPPTSSSQTLPTAAAHPPSLANATRRMFAQQELDSCWVLLFVDRRPHTRRSSGALAHLHVCSTRRADFAYSPSLACKCESEHFHPIHFPVRSLCFPLYLNTLTNIAPGITSCRPREFNHVRE